MSFKEKYFGREKERRKRYRGSKRFDCSCRNNGSCGYCKGNRKYGTNKRKEESNDKINENEEGNTR
jgi:hypothetical protein